MWQYCELEKESEKAMWKNNPGWLSLRNRAAGSLKTLVQFLPSEERKKDRRKDKILKRDHSFPAVCLGGRSWWCLLGSPAVILDQSQKTWYLWPVQFVSGATNKVVRHRSQVGVCPEPDPIVSVWTGGQTQEPGSRNRKTSSKSGSYSIPEHNHPMDLLAVLC